VFSRFSKMDSSADGIVSKKELFNFLKNWENKKYWELHDKNLSAESKDTALSSPSICAA
jgi:hypothetical protein